MSPIPSAYAPAVPQHYRARVTDAEALQTYHVSEADAEGRPVGEMWLSSLAGILRDNDPKHGADPIPSDDLDRLRRLEPGAHVLLGGGAAGGFRFERFQ